MAEYPDMEKKSRKKADASRKKESDPSKPKRPTTAYFYYLANCRAENNRLGNTPLKVTEFSRIYAGKWKTLPPDEKKIYEDMALKDRERWLQETGKLNNDSDNMKPKRPQSAYLMFLKDYRKNNSGKMKASALISKAAEEWRILPDMKKKVYTKQFLEDQARYQQEKENYVNGKKDEVQLAKRPRREKFHNENFESEVDV
ncbi:HMG1/2-like protein [Octopus sinensis]|uniref:HMG1/2-like protein n=1 Tax=Octopus sinensis TaxID=2607531 RepID=A0A6P7S6F7_9MOLL|nr:HMG1/2-like protein [Octopus sinensis]